MPVQKTGVADEFSAIVYVQAVETAANTLTFQQIQTGYGSLEKTGWIVNRIEYYLSAAMINLIDATDDVIQLALTTSNLIDPLTLQSAALLDLFEIQKNVDTGVGFEFLNQPFIRDFSHLPGGGRIVLPYPIFLAVKGTSLASAITAACRIFFTERALADQEWMELVQQTRLLT